MCSYKSPGLIVTCTYILLLVIQPSYEYLQEKYVNAFVKNQAVLQQQIYLSIMYLVGYVRMQFISVCNRSNLVD
jgi:hypothetical protein